MFKNIDMLMSDESESCRLRENADPKNENVFFLYSIHACMLC
jgi:hypothetical protein